MAISKKETIGWLLLIIFASTGVVYISLRDELRIRMDDDKAVFYVKDSRWLISGLQEDRLFNGSRIINRVTNTIIRGNYTYNGLRIEYRFTGYKSGESILHTWTYDPYPQSIEDFPLNEEQFRVDFTNQEYITAVFLNASFGKLHAFFKKEVIKEKMILGDMTEQQAFLVGKVLANAAIYWNDGKYKNAVDTVIAKMTEEMA